MVPRAREKRAPDLSIVQAQPKAHTGMGEEFRQSPAAKLRKSKISTEAKQRRPVFSKYVDDALFEFLEP
ncbi:hypothetical protein HPB48_003885 [Haemaphysalis longicornis]|uniref:Uncharacterized protein n=1 Tax=Haemaphysalis longicornis TaxID=44386 RepID=A0A9J6FG98_HAELO|nr:hypothetical protein HPB48_003885 [Haemaphysalis longicornis]